jgi:hypothetical protein
VVFFDVEEEALVEVVAPEEGEDGVDVGVVLMQRGLAWLGLDQQFAGEAYGVGVVCNRLEERGQVLLFFVHAGVEQRVVALAATPQHVICPAEEVRRFERLFHLPRCVGEHAEIGVGGGAVFVPYRMLHKNSVCGKRRGVHAVAEKIRGAPKNTHAGLLLLGFHVTRYFHEICVGLVEVYAAVGQERGGSHVAVVESVELHAQNLK